MCVPVLWVGKDRDGHITHIGGATATGMPWGLTVGEAVTAIDSRLWDFFTHVGDRYAMVVVRGSGGQRHLTTIPDSWTPNNLDSLPVNPAPLAGLMPGFPLSLPGPSAMSQTRIRSIQVLRNRRWETLFTGDHAVGSSLMIPVPQGFHDGNPPTFRLDVLVPFPAQIGAADPVVLPVVTTDAPEPRRSIEEAGRGWCSIDYVLTHPDGTPDPTKPSRMTEARMHVRPTRSEWRKRRYGCAVTATSINVNCLMGGRTQTGGQAVGFTLVEPTSPPVQPPSDQVTVPGVIGQRLDAALTALWAVPLQVTLIGPVDVNTNLQVESQSPAAGSRVRRNSGVVLTTQRITAPTGVKELRIENRSNRQAALGIWLFDHSTGAWSHETTVDYEATETVSFEDGHLFTVAAIDPQMPYCSTGDPTDVDCVYASPTRQFDGDDDGATLDWTVT
ncbi:hypothetical protein GCM10009651_29000 [Microbacterium natoriense]|uniref:DUF3892 domain-containing protein n=1 Tax=Microbacterium natoriense TaxID=284570 RepID=UPI0031DB8EE7